MRRPALPALALAAALALTACAGADPEEQAAPASTPASTPAEPVAEPATAAPTPAAPAPTTGAPAEPELQTVELVYEGGRVTGDTGRVEVPAGSTFRLVVTSDVADEVHVHGYDRYLPLTPGTPATADVEATIPGVFEVELHDAGTVLTRLAVR